MTGHGCRSTGPYQLLKKPVGDGDGDGDRKEGRERGKTEKAAPERKERNDQQAAITPPALVTIPFSKLSRFPFFLNRPTAHTTLAAPASNPWVTRPETSIQRCQPSNLMKPA